MRVRAAIPLVVLLLAGCGRAPDVALNPNQMNEIAEHGTAGGPQGPGGGTGLQPLVPADLGGVQPLCMLVAAEGPVLAYVPGAGLVKRNGQVMRLTPDGPVDTTGGFFTSAPLSVSVGRTSIGDASVNMAAPRSPRARVRVNDRPASASAEFEGDWRCGAPS